MEIISKRINLPKRTASINVYFIGDIHEGNINVDHKALKKAVDIIKNDRRGYWVGMGDYIDGIVTTDKRFDPTEVDKAYLVHDLSDLPRKQADTLLEYLSPIKNKCIGLVMGNHEEKYIKHNAFDVYGYIAEKLDAPKINYVGDLIIFLTSNGKAIGSFSIALNHGTGTSGTTPGAKINTVARTFQNRQADLCVMGHIHKLFSFNKRVLSVNKNATDYREVVRWYGCSGCFLRTYVKNNKNYYEHKGKESSDIGFLKVKLGLDGEFQKIIEPNEIFLA